jgi:cytosine/adenosine deaminase-related metal-dependent hydrolase
LEHSFLVRNARLRSGVVTNIAVSNGRIVQMKAGIKGIGKVEIDAKRRLTTETFVIAHLHLDKVLTGPLAPDTP